MNHPPRLAIIGARIAFGEYHSSQRLSATVFALGAETTHCIPTLTMSHAQSSTSQSGTTPFTVTSASGGSSGMSGGVGGMKVPAMPVRCKSVDALLQEADGTSSRSSESRSSRHFAFTSSSAGESRAVVKPSPSAPGSSHGTPAAGSVHLDVAASASDADTEPYDDQYDALHSSSKQSHGHGARVDRPLGQSPVSHSHVVKDSGRVTRQSAAIASVDDPGVA